MFSRGKKDAPVVIPGLPEDYAAVVASLRGREPDSDDRLLLAGGETPASVLAVSTALAQKEKEQPPEPEKPIVDPRTLEIGQVVEGKGVYQGTWSPSDSNGRSLGKTFDLYAAPEDIRDDSGDNLLMTFNDAVRHVSRLQNWHGHNGGNFENDKAVMQAVRKNPEQLENWFISTREILHGQNADGEKVQDDHLYGNREKMPSGGEFVTRNNGSGLAHCYWSCTEHREHASSVYVIAFTDGDDGWARKDNGELSTRPVRAELRP